MHLSGIFAPLEDQNTGIYDAFAASRMKTLQNTAIYIAF